MLWSDNMLIPQKPPHAYGAETFMNYVYDPQVAAKIAAYVNYFYAGRRAPRRSSRRPTRSSRTTR